MKLSRRNLMMSAAAATFLGPVLRSSRVWGQNTTPPKRLVFLHTPLGTVREAWLPSGSETSFTLSPILQPLAPHKNNLLVIDGLNFAPTPAPSGATTGNHHEPGSMFTGRSCEDREEASKHTNISLDQYLKSKFPSTLRVKSLELMTAYNSSFSARADRSLFSAAGPNLPVVPEIDPVKAFDRTFAGVTSSGTTMPTGPDPVAEQLRLKRKSVLDLVHREISSLQPQLTGAERLKLDQHLTSVRELEAQFAVAPASQPPVTVGCVIPSRPGSVPTYEMQSIPQRLKNHMQVVAAAMACDLARVAIIGSENGQGRASPGWLGSGFNTNWHDAFTHNSGGHAEHQRIHTWFAEQFAYLINLFKSVPEGSGTMLDNTALVMFSEQGCRYLSGGPTEHSKQNLPYVVAGSCGGYFKQNRFVSLGGKSHKDFLFNCLEAMGYATPQFGTVTGTPLAGLKA